MAEHSGLHEPRDEMDQGTIERHRAIMSLQEELEAVDWYDQRIAATRDEELKSILIHNRDEEKEHASMLLEWLRRHDDRWDGELSDYLFTTRPVTEVEDAGGPETPAGGETLGIGSLRKDIENE